MEWFTALFGSKNDLSALQECARAALIFVYGLALVRLMGRRVFGKWAALDIIVSIIVGSNLSRALTGGAPLPGTLLASAVLMGLHWILAHAAARSTALSRIVEGRSETLAEDGRLSPERTVKHAVSEADITEALRQNGVETVEETRLITLEPSGRINVLKPGRGQGNQVLRR